MIELAVASNKDLLFPVESSNQKLIDSTNNSKDFAAVLEKTKNEHRGVNTQDSTKCNSSKQSGKTKAEEDSPKDKEKKLVTKNTKNELLDMLKSIYEMVLFLKENPDKIDIYDMETLQSNLKELSNICENLLTMDKMDYSGVFDSETLGELISLLKLNSDNNELIFVGNEEVLKLKEILTELDTLKEDRIEGTTEEIKAVPQENIKDNLKVSMNKTFEGNKNNEEIPKEVTNDGESKPNKSDEILGKEILNIAVNSEVAEENYEAEDNSKEYQMDDNSPTLELLSSLRDIPKSDFHIENFQQIDKENLVQQIVDNIKLSLSNDKQEIKLKLKPDILGELILKMELKDGNLTAKLIVDNYKTKELIEANLMQLKEQIKDNGLEIRTFEVYVGTNEDFEKNERERFYSSKNSNRIKIKGNTFKEFKSYDDSYGNVKSTPYYDGKLNLFA